MFKPLAVAVGLGCTALSLDTNAYQYGEYAGETLERLITDYPGHYRGTASFTGASELMQSRLGLGYQTSRRDFIWTGNRSSQNITASAPGSSGKLLVFGTHYDTYYDRLALQSLDDNASGTAVLIEITHNLGGITLESGLKVVGFDTEEEGLRGPHAYAESLDVNRCTDLLGVINPDNLVTGDKVYVHVGPSGASNPTLGTYHGQTLHIVHELDTPLFISPSPSTEYSAGADCYSNGESFGGVNTPMLFIETANRKLGDLGGYEQTNSPMIPNGSAWHNPTGDNKEVLTNALGQERIEQHMRGFLRLPTRLVLELTSVDLLASTVSDGALARQMEDQLQRQHQALARLHDRRWLTLLGNSRPIGSFDGEVGAEGEILPGNGLSMSGDPESGRAGVHLLDDYRYSGALALGGNLAFQHSRDRLDRGGCIEDNTWQFDLFDLYNDGGPERLTDESNLGHIRYDSKRSVYLQVAGSPALLDQCLPSNAPAWSWDARLKGDYGFNLGGLQSGPPTSLDHMCYRIDDFREDKTLHTTLGCGKQDYDSLEADLGWRLRGELALGARMYLQPYASLRWVRELADGHLEDVDLTSHGDGYIQVTGVNDVDKDLDHAQLGAQLAIAEQLEVFVEANSRFAHNKDSQAGYSLGVNWRF